MKIKHITRLTDLISAVCPCHGVDEDGNIDTPPHATDVQKAAAKAIVDSFDDSDAAQDAWMEDRQPERKTLRQQAANAIGEIDAFLAIASPTAAQVRDEVRRICQRQRAIIRRLIQID